MLIFSLQIFSVLLPDLVAELHSAIGAYNASRAPSAIHRAQHCHDSSNLEIISWSPSHRFCILDIFLFVNPWPSSLKRRVLYEWPHPVSELWTCFAVHVSGHGTGVDCIDGRSFGQFTRPITKSVDEQPVLRNSPYTKSSSLTLLLLSSLRIRFAQ